MTPLLPDRTLAALLHLCNGVRFSWHPEQDYFAVETPTGVYRVECEDYDLLIQRGYLASDGESHCEVTPVGRYVARMLAAAKRVGVKAWTS